MEENKKRMVKSLQIVINDLENRVLPNISDDVTTDVILSMLGIAVSNSMTELNDTPMTSSTFLDLQFLQSFMVAALATEDVHIQNPKDFYTKVIKDNLNNLHNILHKLEDKPCASCPEKEVCDSEKEQETKGDTAWDQATVH